MYGVVCVGRIGSVSDVKQWIIIIIIIIYNIVATL